MSIETPKNDTIQLILQTTIIDFWVFGFGDRGMECGAVHTKTKQILCCYCRRTILILDDQIQRRRWKKKSNRTVEPAY